MSKENGHMCKGLERIPHRQMSEKDAGKSVFRMKTSTDSSLSSLKSQNGVCVSKEDLDSAS